MKRILNLPTLLLLFVAALFMTSCEDEPGTGGGGTGGNDEAPSISLVSASDLTLAPGEQFTIEFTADKGTNDMNAVTVYQDGVALPLEDVIFNGTAAGSNPASLFEGERESLSWTTTLSAQTTAGTTSSFEVEVRDDAASALRSSIFVNVTTASAPPTLTALGNLTPTYTEGTQNVSFKVQAETGGGDLATMELLIDGTTVGLDNFNWNGLSMMTSGNPFELSDAEKTGFDEGEFLVDLPMEVGVFVYTAIVEDVFGQRDSASFTVTTEMSGTPVETREDEVLNQDGEDAGGLDLDNGENVPSNSAMAELVDNGIDTDLIPSQNWLQTISAVNGAAMKYVVAAANGVPEGYSFAVTQTKEEIESLFTNNTGTEINSSNSTSVVVVGDEFVVSANGNYWLLTVKEVVVTDNDNKDKYIFDVKF